MRAGGIGIVAASDIVLAADDATFALTEVKLGLTPAVISLTVLLALVATACTQGPTDTTPADAGTAADRRQTVQQLREAGPAPMRKWLEEAGSILTKMLAVRTLSWDLLMAGQVAGAGAPPGFGRPRRDAGHPADCGPPTGGLMPKLRLHLTFPEGLIRDPIIWRLGRQYDIITNIRRANVEENFAQVRPFIGRFVDLGQ